MKRWIPVLTLFLLATSVQAGEWHVDKKAKDNLVTFTSEVIALTFDGTTDQVDGYIYWEGEQLFERKAQFTIEVDMASFDTGMGKRNSDMRDVIGTKKWPKAIFKGEIVQHTPDSTAAHVHHMLTRGTLSLHGVERKIDVPATIEIAPGHSIIAANFTMRLEDYNIEAPSLAAFVKVSEEVAVAVHFTMKHIEKEKNSK
ncbi:MAG: polyisoprenoid-binding protein YceI [Candidatus Latescibacterota bacterium]|jgi:polyisoprenoid-binding protein YceI